MASAQDRPGVPEDFERPHPSPATELPPRSEYRPGIAERFGDDASTAPTAIYACLVLSPVFIGLGFLLAELLKVTGVWVVPFALGVGALGGLGVLYGSMFFARRIGKGVGGMVLPSGATTPYQRQFSQQDALAAAGRIDEALDSYEAEVAAAPADVEAIMRTADLYLQHKRNPERAAELLRSVRRIAGARPEKVLYASHRLVDLYLGALNDRGRAIVELRIIIDRFPGSQAATFAREGLARLKREHHEDAGRP